MKTSEHAIAPGGHSHRFDEGDPMAERNTRWVVALTAAMMVAEISAGMLFNSMALLADGWHMSTHAVALGVSAFAYHAARRFAHDARFAFGTWKIEVLGGFASAILLAVVAGLMLYESVVRMFKPAAIAYDQAIVVAGIGLAVNLACAWLLRGGHSHSHGSLESGHQHHQHDRHGGDLNLKSAYLHVVADAATSVLALVALFAGRQWGAAWMDPFMGVVGAVMVGIWSVGLLRQTGRVLLDAEMDAPVVEEIREVVASLPGAPRIADLHVWRVGKEHYACILALRTHEPIDADQVRNALSIHEEIVHVTVESMPIRAGNRDASGGGVVA